MVLGVQIFGILFGLFMLYIAFLHQKRKEFAIREGIFWISLWIIFLFLTLYPKVLEPFLRPLNIGRTFDLLVIIGFMFLTGAVFYIYIIMRGTQKKIEEVVRKIAIEKK